MKPRPLSAGFKVRHFPPGGRFRFGGSADGLLNRQRIRCKASISGLVLSKYDGKCIILSKHQHGALKQAPLLNKTVVHRQIALLAQETQYHSFVMCSQCFHGHQDPGNIFQPPPPRSSIHLKCRCIVSKDDKIRGISVFSICIHYMLMILSFEPQIDEAFVLVSRWTN